MIITLDHTDSVAKNIQTFWFKPQHKLDYIAGQFIEMFLPHADPDERGIKHWFTLSSSPTEDLISITTKHDPLLSSTFKKTLFELLDGSEIKISEPMGDFVLPKDVSMPLVFVAGGIGITPIRSIIKWLSDTNEKRNIHLIYSVKDPAELAFKDLFDSYGTPPHIVISDDSNHLSGTRILEIAGSDPHQLIYVSGPEPMTEALETQLLKLGVSKDKLVLDFFPGYPIL